MDTEKKCVGKGTSAVGRGGPEGVGRRLVGALLIGALAAPAKEDKVAKSSHTYVLFALPQSPA